jgi:non-canonical purine NTP pyrophosphatase (RdgB/HAM1 family)
MALYFITGNKNKFEEVQAIIPEVEMLDIDLPEIQSLDAREIIKAKLEAAIAHHEGELIVEDNSLYLEGLNGLPGPLIKWFLKTVGNEGLVKMAEAFANVNAQAKVMIGYTGPDKNIEFFEGTIDGTIVEPRGTGFGWDPIFSPKGYDKTFGEMSAEEKNKISMRAIAANKLKEYLAEK